MLASQRAPETRARVKSLRTLPIRRRSDVDVKRSQKYAVTPAEMWERIGDFHGLHKWHPHVVETEVREENVRALTLQNGRTTVETKIDEGELHHSYRIDESDLPVKNFEATLLVRESGEGADGSEIVWTAQFDAHGAEDADAAEIVEGVFEAGLRSLQETA